jgi:hypothetical protein
MMVMSLVLTSVGPFIAIHRENRQECVSLSPERGSKYLFDFALSAKKRVMASNRRLKAHPGLRPARRPETGVRAEMIYPV